MKSGTDKRKILDLVSKEYGTMIWATLKWLRIVVQQWALVNKRISGFNKSRKFLNWLKQSAFHRTPFTKKSVVFFSSNFITLTGHNCFLLFPTAKADTWTTHPTWQLWFSGISHTVKSQKSEDLVYPTAEARNHTSYMHSVVNKVLARNGMMLLLLSLMTHLAYPHQFTN